MCLQSAKAIPASVQAVAKVRSPNVQPNRPTRSRTPLEKARLLTWRSGRETLCQSLSHSEVGMWMSSRVSSSMHVCDANVAGPVVTCFTSNKGNGSHPPTPGGPNRIDSRQSIFLATAQVDLCPMNPKWKSISFARVSTTHIVHWQCAGVNFHKRMVMSIDTKRTGLELRSLVKKSTAGTAQQSTSRSTSMAASTPVQPSSTAASAWHGG